MGGCSEKNSKILYLKKHFLYLPFSSDGTKFCFFARREGTFGKLRYGDCHSLNLCLNVMSVHHFALSNNPRYPLIKRQGGPHIGCEPSEEDINLLPVPGIRNCWQKVVYRK